MGKGGGMKGWARYFSMGLMVSLVVLTVGCTGSSEAKQDILDGADIMRASKTQAAEEVMTAAVEDLGAKKIKTAAQWDKRADAVVEQLQAVRADWDKAAAKFETAAQDSGATDVQKTLARSWISVIKSHQRSLDAVISTMKMPGRQATSLNGARIMAAKTSVNIGLLDQIDSGIDKGLELTEEQVGR